MGGVTNTIYYCAIELQGQNTCTFIAPELGADVLVSCIASFNAHAPASVCHKTDVTDRK